MSSHARSGSGTRRVWIALGVVVFGALADALAAYVELLRGHIFKENNVLFPMAEQVLPEAEQSGLAERFEEVENEEIGPGVHERYHALAHELAGV